MAMTASRLKRFISELAAVELSDRACNQYSRLDGDLPANAIRRHNLRLYLHEIEAIAPSVLLVGEAPSHRGGRLTGIPFVSETVLLSGVDIRTPPHRILGADRGYRKATPGPRLSTEASATMVWETIRDIDPLPILWNAFPFHPFHRGNPESNRVPDAGELRIGEHFIAALLRLFPIQRIVAIGNQAGASLTRMSIEHVKIRHPSQGGKLKFVEGISTYAWTAQS
jgi:uracil-DNA glycosylase